jgi:hypothetical protein
MMMAPMSATLDSGERRKLVKEIREEIKPLIAQIADFQIEKANSILKTQIRKIENDSNMEDSRIHEKIDREIKATQELAKRELRQVEKDIKESIRSFQRQRARDKADFDIQIKAQVDEIASHSAKLDEHAVNFEAIAIVNSMLIENINMQLEGEISDLMDRRMMALFGISTDSKIDKIDVQNTTKKLKKLQQSPAILEQTASMARLDDSILSTAGEGSIVDQLHSLP